MMQDYWRGHNCALFSKAVIPPRPSNVPYAPKADIGRVLTNQRSGCHWQDEMGVIPKIANTLSSRC